MRSEQYGDCALFGARQRLSLRSGLSDWRHKGGPLRRPDRILGRPQTRFGFIKGPTPQPLDVAVPGLLGGTPAYLNLHEHEAVGLAHAREGVNLVQGDPRIRALRGAPLASFRHVGPRSSAQPR